MGIAHSRPMRPPAGRARAVVSMLLAFLLFAGLMPFLTVASTPTRAEAAGSVPVLLHFKDLAGETVDFSSTTASYVDNGDTLEALVDPDGSLCLEDALSVAVYEHYATFGDRQRDITAE